MNYISIYISIYIYIGIHIRSMSRYLYSHCPPGTSHPPNDVHEAETTVSIQLSEVSACPGESRGPWGKAEMGCC